MGKKNFWDKFANVQETKLSKASQKALDGTLKVLKESDTVLDFGCGSGDITLAIADHVKSIHGIDTSVSMIEASINKSKDKTNASFSCRDIHSIKDEYTVVTAFNVLQYLKNHNLLFKKFNSILKPDGLFIIATAFMGEKKSFSAYFFGALSKLRIVPPINFMSIKKITTDLNNNGFVIKSDEVISEGYSEHLIICKKIKQN